MELLARNMKKLHPYPIIDENVNDVKMVMYPIIMHQHSLRQICLAIQMSQWTIEKQIILHG